MASDDSVTWAIVGGIFGGIFVITCIISSVKAVKDRKRIKTRIAEKRRQRLEHSAYDNYNEIEPCNQETSPPNISIEVQLNDSPAKSKYDHEYTSNRSNTSQASPVRLTVPKNNTLETVPPWEYIPSNSATKNVVRRNSYDIAIGRYTVICNKYGGAPISNGAHSVAYENSAYRCDGSFDTVL